MKKKQFLSMGLAALLLAGSCTYSPTYVTPGAEGGSNSSSASGAGQETAATVAPDESKDQATDSKTESAGANFSGAGLREYVGKIDGRYPIRAVFQVRGGQVQSGKYFYESSGEDLIWMAQENGLAEYNVKGALIGSLSLSGDDNITGTWTNKDGSKRLRVELRAEQGAYTHAKVDAFAAKVSNGDFLGYLHNFAWVHTFPITNTAAVGMSLLDLPNSRYRKLNRADAEEALAGLCYLVGDKIVTVHYESFMGSIGMDTEMVINTYSGDGSHIDQEVISMEMSMDGSGGLITYKNSIKLNSNGSFTIEEFENFTDFSNTEQGKTESAATRLGTTTYRVGSDGKISRS